jgi:hypothetical protein
MFASTSGSQTICADIAENGLVYCHDWSPPRLLPVLLRETDEGVDVYVRVPVHGSFGWLKDPSLRKYPIYPGTPALTHYVDRL